MKTIYMDFSPFSVRSAYVLENELAELFVDSKENESLAGNIYAARVKDVIKGQFAFCDIGCEKNGFLQLDDFRQRGIAGEIKQGSQIIVQLIRDSVGEKGPYLSGEISFTAKNIILVKADGVKYVKLSQKIIDEAERKRLNEIGQRICPEGFGMIIRTSAYGIEESILKAETDRLLQRAEEILNNGKYIKAPARLNGGEELFEKSLLSILDDNPDKIVINSESQLEAVRALAYNYCGFPSENVVYYYGTLPMFDCFNLERQIGRITNKQIWLKSGAFLLIEQTAACSFIDINTGKFPGKKSFEETAHFVNMEAAAEVCRQIRLRNLSGLIIIDFISTRSEDNNKLLAGFFTTELIKDRNPAVIADWSSLNTVQLTRKKTRPPLLDVLTDCCLTCGGTGKVINKTFIADNIYKCVKRIFLGGFYDIITIKANKHIIPYLKNGLENDFVQGGQFIINYESIDTVKMNYYEIIKEKR